MSHEEALGYAHILVIILVFVLEVSVLVIERSSEDRHVRHLLHKRAPRRLMTWLMGLTLFVIVGLLIVAGTGEGGHPGAEHDRLPARSEAASVSDPDRPKPDSAKPAAVVPTVAVPKPPAATPAPVGAVPTNPSQGKGKPPVSRGSAPPPVHTSAIDTFVRGIDVPSLARICGGALLLLFGICWFMMMRSDPRKLVINHLTRSMVSSWKKRHIFNDDDIEDLIVLGENSEPGHEKHMVLQALKTLSYTALRSSGYDGNELGTLIHGLERVVASTRSRGTIENVLSAIHILETCRRPLEALRPGRKPDLDALTDTVAGIGEFAVSVFPDAVALACLDAAPKAESIPFRIGTAALRARRFPIVVAALNRLHAIADSTAPSPELIALSAYLCCEGVSATETVHRLQSQQWAYSDISAAAMEAAEAYYLQADFSTADTVREYVTIVGKWATPARV